MGEKIISANHEYEIMLTWKDVDDNDIYCVDFKIYSGWLQSDGERLYTKTQDEPTTIREEAEFEVRGFIKWDGCTQFEIGDSMIHWDSSDDMNRLFETLKLAREQAALVMRKKWIEN